MRSPPGVAMCFFGSIANKHIHTENVPKIWGSTAKGKHICQPQHTCPPLIATSGYAFFGGMEKYQPMLDLYNIKNVDDFAKIVFQGQGLFI